MKNLLLLSNSTMPGEPYFQWPKNFIDEFLGHSNRSFMFIPFAGVTFSYDEYFESVATAFSVLGCTLKSLHKERDKKRALEASGGIVVGGGNSFQLLDRLYAFDLLDTIRAKVNSGASYIGWSAGANVCCPTIMTTNDMPIVQPPSLQALELVKFQINPHYTEATLPNHGGESRSVRLKEFIEINRDVQVVGLPEGNLLEIASGKIELKGSRPAKIFKYGEEPVEVLPGENIDRLLEL